jgi:hypothetical protein
LEQLGLSWPAGRLDVLVNNAGGNYDFLWLRCR